jgi:hypothetical protein
MRRAIVIVAAGASLAGCSSLSLDALKPTPPPLQVQLESTPSGADARTSLGPGCKTPCSVSLTAPENGFSVTYSLSRFQPATIPVQVIHNPGDWFSAGTTRADPNPVVAQLQPAAPPPPPVRKKLVRPRKPKPPKSPTAAAPAESPFPDAPAPGSAPAAPAAAPPPAAPSR